MFFRGDFIMTLTKRIFKIILFVFLFYLLYFLITFVLIFKTKKTVPTDIAFDKTEITSASTQNLYATIIETPKEAFDVRLRLIEKATTKINIAYFAIRNGRAGHIFLSSLLKKADEGIEINIILDGLVKAKDEIYKTLRSHEKINFYIYEDISLLFLQNNQNLLHDKIIIVDNKYGLTGGRNISDRFMLHDSNKVINDRDVLIYSDEETTIPVVAMDEYFQSLLASSYAKTIKHKNYSESKIAKYHSYYDEYITEAYAWDYFVDNNIKVDNATFVYGPLNRMNKYPIVAETIFSLYEEGQKMTIQSPYITTSKMMKQYFKVSPNENITLLTNSISTNPNFFAATSYSKQKKMLANYYNLYEIQSTVSSHAKTITIGNNISVIGSLNMDHRSFFLSTENVLIIYSEEFNEKLNVNLNNIITNSLKVKSDGSYQEDENVQPLKDKKIKLTAIKIASYLTRLFEEMLTKIYL